MANLPTFKHIHCSSRYDRSPESLETDLDVWMANSSIVTLTEITNDRRAAKLQEKGWGYYNSKLSGDADNCGICWRLDTWKRTYGAVRKLSAGTFDRVHGQHNLYIWAATVVLKNVSSGHRLMVSCSHLPSHIMGAGGFRTTEAGWQGRKIATLTALNNWSTHLQDLERKQKVDATLVIADWNLNLKDSWVWNLLHDRFTDYRSAWNYMPTSGGALAGGATVPKGSPGAGQGDRIIDGTLYSGVQVTDGPVQMARVRSSDHRPYHESFQFLHKAGQPIKDHTPTKPAAGDVKTKGHAWWGFGDYLNDELYDENVGTGSAGGEVL